MKSIIFVFGISLLCAAGACAIWEKVEDGVRYIIKSRNAKKERERKRTAAKEFMNEFCRSEKNKILIRETFIWGNEIDSLVKERKNKNEGRDFFEKF